MQSSKTVESKLSILVLRNKEGLISANIQSQLDRLSKEMNSNNYQIEFYNEPNNTDNESLLASKINQGNYDLVLLDRNIASSAWSIIQDCSEDKPQFYLDGDLSNLVDKEFTHAKFSGAVCIAKNGELLVKTAYREANRYTAHPVPNQIGTKFNIGSIGKMMTAVGVIKMVEDYHLDFHKPIRDFLPPNHPYLNIFKDFTLHELLTHTSGLAGGVQEPFFKTDMIAFQKLHDTLPWLNRVEILEDKDIQERHHKHVYSNPGFFLLGFAIEAITGQDYYEYIQTNVCKPVGMTSTLPRRVINDRMLAIPYTKKPTHDLSTESAWLATAKVSEHNSEVMKFIIQAENLIQSAQECMNQAYPKIDELIRLYQIAAATIHDEESYLKFRLDFTQKLKSLCAEFSKYDAIANTVKESHGQLREWLDANKDNPVLTDSMETINRLIKLFEQDGLYSVVNWPIDSIYGFINTMSMGHPAGCWSSTLSDLIAFDEALWNRDGALVRYGRTMIQPAEAIQYGYGYGITIRDPGEQIARGHFGGAPGSLASNYNYPTQGMSVVTLANDESLGLRMPLAIEENLVFGADNGIYYFDPRIASGTKLSFVDNAKSILDSKKQLALTAKPSAGVFFPANQPVPNQQLKELYEADQSERDGGRIPNPLNDKKRRELVNKIMSSIGYPTREDYYHAAMIYHHGETLLEYKKAHQYAKKSLQLGLYKPATLPAKDNLFLFASTYDRWQLNSIPPRPQKYGTQYAIRNDNSKGWIKDELIPPPIHGFRYDKKEIEEARHKIGLQTLAEQEKNWGIDRSSIKPFGVTH